MRVAQLAMAPYKLAHWREWSREIARGLAGTPVEQILAVMVHPGPPPPGIRPWSWLYRLQVAAALVVAGLDAGWQGSVRRRALLSLVNGPVDWSINAALIALSIIAAEDPAAEAEIAEAYKDLYRRAPRQGDVCYMVTLCQCALMRPNPEAGERGHWEETLAAVRGS
jgi:hypothetical protein